MVNVKNLKPGEKAFYEGYKIGWYKYKKKKPRYNKQFKELFAYGFFLGALKRTVTENKKFRKRKTIRVESYLKKLLGRNLAFKTRISKIPRK